MQIIGSEVTLFVSLNIKETLGDEGALIGSVQVMCVRLPLDVIETLEKRLLEFSSAEQQVASCSHKRYLPPFFF